MENIQLEPPSSSHTYEEVGMGRLKTKLQELQETLELQENMAYDHCAAK
jgi:hypothetical protein